MAAGWITLLQSVPWSDVIRNAPKVAEGARKLWNAARARAAGMDVEDAGAAPLAGNAGVAALESRLGSLEASVEDIRAQLLASSEIIQALADQNAQLIRRLEALRIGMLWLGATIAVVAVVAIGLALAL
jgi:hypothetical protein